MSVLQYITSIIGSPPLRFFSSHLHRFASCASTFFLFFHFVFPSGFILASHFSCPDCPFYSSHLATCILVRQKVPETILRVCLCASVCFLISSGLLFSFKLKTLGARRPCFVTADTHLLSWLCLHIRSCSTSAFLLFLHLTQAPSNKRSPLTLSLSSFFSPSPAAFL